MGSTSVWGQGFGEVLNEKRRARFPKPVHRLEPGLRCRSDQPLTAAGVAEPVTWVANCSFPGGVQTSNSFCMKMPYVSKDLQKGL